MSERLVSLGEIVTTHGIAGWLKLNPYNIESPSFAVAGEVILEKDRERFPFFLESSRRHGRQILIKLDGIDTIDSARRWVGAILAVKEESLLAPGPGEYYHYQVIGFSMVDPAGAHIGIVSKVWSTPGGELYVVTGHEKEHLIPAVKEIVQSVDFEAGKITVNPPPGLLDL